ncbi:transcriptional regulator, TetR family [Chryseobacterium piscicola]|uniref:TetR family transcriptional regulator n=1 Tax=Chryseobacterium piscicola TaxID=551459 RepID=A0A1N7KAT3_9FLAO|nr:TetR/AcrR family transcriptional regulator [Chryseobacterium piscicola]PQA96416.1 TetR family transcriptional regulator [Chryseobacterium piscicola]SIS58534.1 transcriptional regulator, TetR family [Chryseobacterium piscicola]
MSKADKTRQFIIEKTATLFNTKGYLSTSLSDITEATGLTKGSVYGNFANRDEVAIEVYKYNSGIQKNHLLKSFGNEYPTISDKLCAFVSFYRKNWRFVFESGGCPLMNAATESDDTFPELKERVQLSFMDWSKTISEIIKCGQDNKEFNQEIIPDDYASLFIILIEGGILLSKTTGEEKHLNLALDRIFILINKEIKQNPL